MAGGSPAATTRSNLGFALSPRVPFVEDRDAKPAPAFRAIPRGANLIFVTEALAPEQENT